MCIFSPQTKWRRGSWQHVGRDFWRSVSQDSLPWQWGWINRVIALCLGLLFSKVEPVHREPPGFTVRLTKMAEVKMWFVKSEDKLTVLVASRASSSPMEKHVRFSESILEILAGTMTTYILLTKGQSFIIGEGHLYPIVQLWKRRTEQWAPSQQPDHLDQPWWSTRWQISKPNVPYT